MIVSCSRRTDVPSFYADWLLGRLRAGFALVPHPYNPRKLTGVSLDPMAVDCLVLWTKDPGPLMGHLAEMDARGWRYYFEFTLNPYGPDLEPGLPPKEELVATFQALSQRLGRERVDWRYDPIVFSPTYPVSFHLRSLAALGERLAPWASRLIISFVDQYRHGPKLSGGTEAERLELAAGLARLGESWGLPIYACAEAMDLRAFGVKPSACLDRAKIEGLTGRPLRVRKDPGQRQACLCLESVDLGVYNSCSRLCAYCYANAKPSLAVARWRAHDPRRPTLTGELSEGAEIVRWLGERRDDWEVGLAKL
ncbi:MAG: DUF1848 domain-containing protein [Deltaproteobacteria bacterium]|jgi:hypothetical protein|nr:DUF1848 domain-containing protein [Deltaproteobacteria bacterium]